MSEKVIYSPPNSTSKITKIVSVWGSAPETARGAYVSSTTFFSGPAMALSRQPPRLFSLVTACRPHSAFQGSTYDYSIISSLCNSARNMLHTSACANAALLTYSAPPYTLAALRWNRGRVRRAFSGEPYSWTLHWILAKALSFGLYLDHFTCIFEKKSDPWGALQILYTITTTISDFLVYYWSFLGTWIDMNFRILHSDWLIFYDI